MKKSLLILGALALSPLLSSAPALAATYAFGSDSEIDYYAVHPMHHVKGVTHTIQGVVSVQEHKLVLPMTLNLPLVSFNSGNSNRDNNAAYTLDALNHPFATLKVGKFVESKHSKQGDAEQIAGTAIGTMTLHGVTREIQLPIQATITPKGLTVDSNFTVLLSDYQITPPSLMFVPLHNDVRVTVHGVASRQGT